MQLQRFTRQPFRATGKQSCHQTTRKVVRCASQLQCDGPSTSERVAATSRLGAAVLSAFAASTAAMLLYQQPVLAEETSRGEQALNEYVDMEVKGKFSKLKELDTFRGKYGIKRNVDGRLMLKSSKGEWYLCRLDMEVPGSMLLRDPKGSVYALQTDSVQQVDLSDDYVALVMFADGLWEKEMSPVELEDDKGNSQQLKLDENEFRQVVGILKAMEAEGDEA